MLTDKKLKKKKDIHFSTRSLKLRVVLKTRPSIPDSESSDDDDSDDDDVLQCFPFTDLDQFMEFDASLKKNEKLSKELVRTSYFP